MPAAFRYTTLGTVFLVAALLGYPVAAVVVHGLNSAVWPDVVLRPDAWFWAIPHSFGLLNLETYLDMVLSSCPAFPSGGLWQALAIFLAPIAACALLLPASAPSRRDPGATFGDARWANATEKSKMRHGIELGIDPDGSQPVRVTVEGNLLSIAPPRAGKTSGLIIPNVWAPTSDAWNGPVVVVDPKGQVHKAVAARRRSLGRRLICLDPFDLVRGSDRWLPTSSIDLNDVLQLQIVARALLPGSVNAESAYFQNRAAMLIVGAMRAAIKSGQPTPGMIAALLDDPDTLAKMVASLDDVTARRVRTLLSMEPRTRDPILSTAAQAFQWCDDPRMEHLTSKSTFNFEQFCRDDADIFLTLPTEAMEILAPFIRWFLITLFMTIRRNPLIERGLIIIDEARVLGRFSELVLASGELPGYGASLWTFWQDRSQISALYGRDDAATLLRTTEFVTLSDPANIDPDECDYWSRALANFTLLQETRTTETAAKQRRSSTTVSPTAARLMTAEQLARLPADELIVFPKSARYAKRPLLLRKTRYDDPRFRSSAR